MVSQLVLEKLSRSEISLGCYLCKLRKSELEFVFYLILKVNLMDVDCISHEIGTIKQVVM